MIEPTFLYPNRRDGETDATVAAILARVHPYARYCEAPVRPAWALRNRRLLDYLLVYFADGEGRFVVDGRGFDAKPGDLFLIPPNTLHDMEGYAPSSTVPFVHFDLLYDPRRSHWEAHIPEDTTDLSRWSRLLHPPLNLPQIDQLRGSISGYTNQQVGIMLVEMAQEFARGLPFARMILSSRILEVLALILRGQYGLPDAQSIYTAALEKGAAFLREHCHLPSTIENAANVAGMSPSYFRQLFGRHFGVAPRMYLRNARIQRAKERMISTKDSLTEIAYEVGFANVHSFSRAFAETEGLPPAAYRRLGMRAGAGAGWANSMITDVIAGGTTDAGL